MYQEKLRDFLREQKHVEKVADLAQEIYELDHGDSKQAQKIQALKAAADIRLKLIELYMPKMSHTELEAGESTIDALLAALDGSSEDTPSEG